MRSALRMAMIGTCSLIVGSALFAAPQEGSGMVPPSKDMQRWIDEAVARKMKEEKGGDSLGGKLENARKELPFDLHGGAYLWHYEPLMAGAKNNTELYYAFLTIDAKEGDFGFHFEPHFRDTKLRPFFNSNIWAQEAYVSWKAPAELGVLKAGKEYSRFGHFWDGTFFGNQPYFDGLKLDPDMGLSLENTKSIDKKLDLEYDLQFFTVDGRTNGSLQDRDTISVAGARRRNMAVARIAPTYHFSDDTSLQLGGSYERFRADFATPTRDDTVTRIGVDSQLVAGPVSVFGEWSHQSGRSVTDFPLTGSVSDDIDYVWCGVDYRWNKVTFRCAYSSAEYKDNHIKEMEWVPAITWAASDHVSLLLEYDGWRRHTTGNDTALDRSLNLILYVYF